MLVSVLISNFLIANYFFGSCSGGAFTFTCCISYSRFFCVFKIYIFYSIYIYICFAHLGLFQFLSEIKTGWSSESITQHEGQIKKNGECLSSPLKS